MNRQLVHTLLWSIIGAACVGGCASPGAFIALETIDMPGSEPRNVDEVVARPFARRVFQAAGGIREVTTISSAGRADIYITSDGIIKRDEFFQAVNDAVADSADKLPRVAAPGMVVILPPGQSVTLPPVRQVNKLSIEFDRAKLVDAGLTEEEVYKAVVGAREQTAPVADPSAADAPAVKAMIQTLMATTLPSRDKPLVLGSVATIRVIAEPDHIIRHWP